MRDPAEWVAPFESDVERQVERIYDELYGAGEWSRLDLEQAVVILRVCTRLVSARGEQEFFSIDRRVPSRVPACPAACPVESLEHIDRLRDALKSATLTLERRIELVQEIADITVRTEE